MKPVNRRQRKFNLKIMIKLYNTLTKKVEEFNPISPPKVSMYTCGPTVYDYMHIGNLRTFLLSDILFRALKMNGYDVFSVQNITDIDDKIVKRAKVENKTISEISLRFTKLFLQDVHKLNIPWEGAQQPKVSKFIGAIVAYIKILISKGYAYQETDGSVYFDISKFDKYGRLSRLNMGALKTGTRVLSDEYTKDTVQDFALWKAVPQGEVGSFPSDLGWGRPGWHIECSVMSQKYLGESFDVHIGGIDLIFPHHENEIAQSEAKTGKSFVNYFVHGEHLLVDGKKMSKSLGNFYTLKDIEEKGFSPLDLRYLYLTAHYRQLMNFTWEALEAAKTARGKLIEFMQSDTRSALSEEKLEKMENYREQFMNAINNDLGAPQALAVVWEVVKSNIPNSDKNDLLHEFDEILGVGLGKVPKVSKVAKVPKDIEELVRQRETLRKEEKFEESDKIRKKMEDMGYLIEDTEQGPKVSKF